MSFAGHWFLVISRFLQERGSISRRATEELYLHDVLLDYSVIFDLMAMCTPHTMSYNFPCCCVRLCMPWRALPSQLARVANLELDL